MKQRIDSLRSHLTLKKCLRSLSSVGLVGLVAACSDPAKVAVKSTKEVFVLEQSPTITGRDGGGSGRLFGRSVWAYGDTILSLDDIEGSNWHHNSFSSTEDFNASDGITGFSEPLDAAGAPQYLIAPTADEAAYNAAHRGDPCAEAPCGARWAVWPGSPVFDEKRGRGIIPYGLIHAEPGDFNFYGVGHSFALWSDFNAPPERPIVNEGAEFPTLLFGKDEPSFGNAPIILDDFLYSIACDGDGFDKPCKLARVALDNLFDRSRWEYWGDGEWSNDIANAQDLFEASDILTVDQNPYLGLFTAIYSDPGSNAVVIRTAQELTGPWSDETTLFTADRKTDEGWVYDAAPHAELSENSGRVQYISFSRPKGTGWFEAEFAVVRVEFE